MIGNIRIRQASEKDLEQIYEIEKSIEGSLAAPVSVLRERMELFNKGFIVAECDGDVCGYLQSCMCDGIEQLDISRFDEFDFKKQHNPKGKYLFILFLAVDKKHQRLNIGTRLMRYAIDLALENGLGAELIAKEHLTETFYKKLGFKKIKKMDRWLKGSSQYLMRFADDAHEHQKNKKQQYM